ncbi:MAG: DUF1059 domain-containing protein [Acidimicrobiales bacterium]
MTKVADHVRQVHNVEEPTDTIMKQLRKSVRET